MQKMYPIKKVFTGKVKSQFGMMTAMGKQSVEGEIFLSALGLQGDECASDKHHGGVERALHQYPSEHYDFWRTKFGDKADWHPAGMGENISTERMTEDDVCIGDKYQWGKAVIQVSQPRSPCYKLNKRWDVETFSEVMQETAKCGWLYRVITPGFVSAAESLILIERAENALTIKQTCDYYFGDPLNPEGLRLIAAQEGLSASWTRTVHKRMETQQVEDWTPRLKGIFA
ncbi:MOSC domain-containing protein [Grimontia kaedaensis]|uniref:MOSC domain-containing protein n=1 Tax=Grimontia kaedaensis TaxID=2872157 RepID=A0ABY4X0B0_9GAMM|nr:MOSC domain-containing protein [Grimontia kaedaensis]USH04688.1 MOSC domain-containing protein [Grimontia kaedaensis]